jgi:putative drug exporter of the RND superfamily
VRENVLVRAGDAAAVRKAVADLVDTLHRSPEAATGVGSPLGPDGHRWRAEEGRSALVTFEVAGPENFKERLARAAAAVAEVRGRHPGVRVDQAGDATLSRAVNDGIKDDFTRAEFTSLPLTLLILLVVFGSLVAAGLPLLLAGSSVAGAFGLLSLVSVWVPYNSAVSSIVMLVGMAVGIDYSLFYLRRFREERAEGRSPQDALRIAARTSGHAVVVSGLTVMACMAGLLLTGIDVFQGLTVGTVLVVGLAVLGSVTVLPALLAALGDRVDRVRVPWLGRRRTSARESRMWAAVVRAVVRRPLLTGGLATLALLVMALPLTGIRLQDAAVKESLPPGLSAAVDAATRIEQVFPGAASPARVMMRGPAVPEAMAALHALAAEGGQVREPITSVRAGDVRIARVPLAGAGTDPASERALAHLRAELGRIDGLEQAVGGRTATAHDFAERVAARTPLVVGFILVLAFVLIVAAFRSVAVAIVSIVLNLLSIGAACGALVWVFQDGNLEGLLGFTSYGGVVSWLPMFMFIVLFGLSMDYHIFILSRIRERQAGGVPARTAIVDGIATSSGVVSSAAVIMVAVFSVFVTLSAIEYKMLGLGMAVAVLLDATLVRGVLMPAGLALLGGRRA